MICAIWHTPADEVSRSEHARVINSPRAAGRYQISDQAEMSLWSYTERQKAHLTAWLWQQRRAGIDIPIVDRDVLTYVKTLRPMGFQKRVQDALVYFDRIGLLLGQRFNIIESEPNEHIYNLLASTQCEDIKELLSLFTMMKQLGWLEGELHSNGGMFGPSTT